MKENKLRKIILAVLFAVIAGSLLLHLSIKGADTKSKISKQVSIGRELVNTADKGNDNGQYSEYAVAQFSEAVEAAAAIMTDRNASEEASKEALKQIREDIQAFKNAENKNSLSKEDIQALMDGGEVKEASGNVTEDIQVDWKLDGKKLTEAAAVNLDAAEDGLYTEQLQEQIQESYSTEELTVFSLRHDGNFPGEVLIRLKGEFHPGKTYLVCGYDGQTDGLEELPVTFDKDVLELTLVHGGDYAVFSVKADKKAGEKGDSETTDEQKPENSQTDEPENSNPKPSGIPQENSKEHNSANNQEPTPLPGTTIQPSNNTGNAGNTDKPAVQPTVPPAHKPGSTAQSTPKPTPAEVQKERTCVIEIRCGTVLHNMDKLKEGLEAYIPGNGVILSSSRVELYDGETVFDVLKRVTRETGIKLEFRNDGVHGAGYIVGINHLNEFDCGEGSGWMYTVNGWFPNYGCAKYVLEDGDVIKWVYTCDLGRDIGGNYWE